MGLSSVAATAGSGVDFETFLNAGSKHTQYVRERTATAVPAVNNWTISLTASAPQVTADTSRVAMLMVNNGTNRVYLRFDSTAPTSTVFHWFLEAGDRWEVPSKWVELAVSMLGTTASGNFLTTFGTAA